MKKCLNFRESKGKTSVPLYLAETVRKEEQAWATPRAGKTTTENPEVWEERKKEGQVAKPPLAMQAGGRLNPNWVEQLMGLPAGWTQLSPTWKG